MLKKILSLISILTVLLALAGCSPTFPLVQDTRPPTATPEPTATLEPTATVEPTATPVDTATPTEVPTVEPTATTACLIKGNVNPQGKKFYHLPGSRYYNQTIVEPKKGDRYFCTEQEAIDAGFVKPAR